MVVFEQAQVHEVHRAAVAAGLASQRDALLASLPDAFRATLPRDAIDSAQLLRDIEVCNRSTLSDGPDPLLCWLNTAEVLAGGRTEERVFAWARAIRTGAADLTLPPPSVISVPARTSDPLITPTPLVPITTPVDSPNHPASNWRRDSTPPSGLVKLPPPPKVTFHFVGREIETHQLAQMLVSARSPDNRPRLAIVTGIGGIGKTALAMHFADRYDEQFPGGILWGDLGMDAAAHAVAGFVLRRWLLLMEGRSPEDASLDDLCAMVARQVTKRTASLGAVLLILDNADNSRALRPILNALSGCSILITRRPDDIDAVPRDQTLHLSGLLRDASLSYLKHELGGEQDERGVAELSPALDQLDGHPLCLALFAAALKRNTMLRPAEFLRRIRRNVAKSIDKERELSTHAPDNLRDCFHGSVAQLPRGPHRPFLLAMASQPAESWSIDAADYVSGVCSPDKTRLLIDDLCALGLVNVAEEGRYKIHRVLGLYLRAAHAGRGLGRVPRTWEIAGLPWLLMRVAPGISAGKAAYDLRQEQWGLRYLRRNKDVPSELSKEWPSILLGLRRRVMLGFGDAMRGRLEILKDYLRRADLSGIRLDRAVLVGANLAGAQLREADLSGEPPRELPEGSDIRAVLRKIAWQVPLSAAVLGLSLLLFILRAGSGASAPKPHDLWVLLPLVLVPIPGPLAAVILRTGPFQRKWLDLSRYSMRWRYAAERATEIAVMWGIGMISSVVIMPLSGSLIFRWQFTLATICFAPLFAVATWMMLRLVRVAGRLEIGGLGIRCITAMIMVGLVALTPLSLLSVLNVEVARILVWALPPMMLYAAAVGLSLSPERHLLTSLRTSFLTRANLRGADLTAAKLRWVKLDDADLRAADLPGADLEHADLTHANLMDANLAGAKLQGACLRGADLMGADLSGADLRATDLAGAKLTNVDDAGTQWPEGFVGPPTMRSEAMVPDAVLRRP